MAVRVLAIAGIFGSVGLLATLCWRRQHLHAVDGLPQGLKGDTITPEVRYRDVPLHYAPFFIQVLNDCGEGNGAHTAHDPEYGDFVEHEDGSLSGTFKLDRRQLGRFAHQYSSIGSVGTADVARSPAAAPAGGQSVAIRRAA